MNAAPFNSTVFNAAPTRRITTPGYVHYLDMLAVRSVVTSHLMDVQARRTAQQGHTTSLFAGAFVIAAQTTDVSARATQTRTQHSNVLGQALQTIMQTTSVFSVTGVTIGYRTDLMARGTITGVQTTDMLAKAVRTQTHGTALLARLSVTQHHGTSSYLSGPVVDSRTRSLRTGTRRARSDGMQTRQQGSTSSPIGFPLYDLGMRPANGRTVTVTLSRDSGITWTPALGTVSNTDYGWYVLQAHPVDRDTLGELLIHAEAVECLPVDLVYTITAPDPYAPLTVTAAERTTLVDTILLRGWLGIASTPARSVLNALRLLRNGRMIDDDNLLQVRDEGGNTPVWSSQVYGERNALPVRGQTPI
jgi:hypothetical protein